MSSTVYILGIVLQLLAAIIALSQVQRAPHKLPWVFISLSSLLIVIRRLETLEQLKRTGHELASAEMWTLVISLLFFFGVLLMSRMFKEYADTHERLRISEAQARAVLTGDYNRTLIEASPDPLVTISADGRICDVNSATELATGFLRSDLIGHDFSEFFTDSEKARAGYQKVFSEGSVSDYPLEIRHRNGQVMPVLYNATVYRDETGAVAGVFAAARDITLLKKAEVELRALYERVAEDAKTKERLLREVNHRVMNNLLSVIGLLISERKGALKRGEQNTCLAIDNLVGKLRSILEVHQLLSDTGWAPVPLATLTQRILDLASASFLPKVRAKKQVAPSSIVVSPRQASTIALILSELTTNTIKHAVRNQNEIAISVTFSVQDGLIKLTYADTGPGYPDDVLSGERSNVGITLIRQLAVETLRGHALLMNGPGAVTILEMRTEEHGRT